MASPTKETWKKRDRRDATKLKRKNARLKNDLRKNPRPKLKKSAK